MSASPKRSLKNKNKRLLIISSNVTSLLEVGKQILQVLSLLKCSNLSLIYAHCVRRKKRKDMRDRKDMRGTKYTY